VVGSGTFKQRRWIWSQEDFGWFTHDLDKGLEGDLSIDVEGKEAEEGHIIYKATSSPAN
jgi:hypothetical protein